MCQTVKTIWKFRETLIQEEVKDALFFKFNQAFDEQCIFANNGEIVYVSIVKVHRQRNSREENELFRQGQTPEGWKQKSDKLRQKGRDARWWTKRKTSFFG